MNCKPAVFTPNFTMPCAGQFNGKHVLSCCPLPPTPHQPQDWLFIAAKRVSGVEYCLLLATFGLVMAFGLEAGIAGGIVLAALHFAYRWAGGWLAEEGMDGPKEVISALCLVCLAVPQPAMPASARLHTLCLATLTTHQPKHQPSPQLLQGHHDHLHSGAQPQRRRCVCGAGHGVGSMVGPGMARVQHGMV